LHPPISPQELEHHSGSLARPVHGPEADALLAAWPEGGGARAPLRKPKAPRAESTLLFRFPHSTDARDPIDVHRGDLDRCAPGEYLNDSLINLGLRQLVQAADGRAIGDATKVHVFSSLFFTVLREGHGKGPRAAYERVLSWARGDLFGTDVVLVPVHDRLHWSLAAVCHLRHLGSDEPKKRPVIVVLDSLVGVHDPEEVAACLRAFLAEEWRSIRGTDGSNGAAIAALRELRLRTPSAPQQANLVDCGVFCLRFGKEVVAAAATAKFRGGKWRPVEMRPGEAADLRRELLEECERLGGAYSAAIVGGC